MNGPTRIPTPESIPSLPIITVMGAFACCRSSFATLSRAAAKSAAKPVAPRSAPRKDNPYLRPFGRLTLEQLETQIAATEAAIAACQAAFGDPQTFKDPARSQQNQTDYEAATEKLRQLEEEYFAREE